MWKLQDPSEDITSALALAKSAFEARIPAFKQTLKALLRLSNEEFGSFGEVFRIAFVLHGLENFVGHFSNDHTKCAQFKYYTRCTQPANLYQPSQEYVNRIIVCGRGPECQAMISLFSGFLSMPLYTAATPKMWFLKQ